LKRGVHGVSKGIAEGAEAQRIEVKAGPWRKIGKGEEQRAPKQGKK